MAENSRKKYLREEYIARINRVIDYIENNFSKALSLDDIADIYIPVKPYIRVLFVAIPR